MNAPPPPVPPAPAPVPSGDPAPVAPPRPLVVRAFSTAVRVAMVLVILGAGYALLDLYRNLFTDPADVAPLATAPGPPPADPATDFRDLLLDDGAWTVGGVGWSVRTRTLAPEELERRTGTAGDPVPPNRAVSDVERDLLKWARGDATRRPVEGQPGCTAYQSGVGAFRVRVVTEIVAGTERVRLGQVVWGGGTLLEFTPAPGADGSAGPLLPVPRGATVQARRWALGQVTAELIGPWEAHGHPQEWVAAGWSGRALDAGGGAGAENEDAGYEFRRGSEVVWVWRFGLPGGGGSLLIARPRAR